MNGQNRVIFDEIRTWLEVRPDLSTKVRQKQAPGRCSGFSVFRYSRRNPTGRTGPPCLQEYFSIGNRNSKTPLDPRLIEITAIFRLQRQSTGPKKPKNSVFAKSAPNDPHLPRGASRGVHPTFWAPNLHLKVAP